MVAFFSAFLCPETNHNKKWRDCRGEQSESPIQPEHQHKHPEDREDVDHDARVPEDAKLWMVSISEVSVLREAATRCLS